MRMDKMTEGKQRKKKTLQKKDRLGIAKEIRQTIKQEKLHASA